MSFASLDFLIFLLLFFIGWPMIKRSAQLRWSYITLASFVFYGWWDWRFLFLILVSGLIDFFAARAIVRLPAWRKGWLLLSLAGNLGLLGAFKYLDFILNALASLAGSLGLHWTLPPLGWILPVGISFYTFQSMSYTIDVYRGRLRPTANVLHFFAYLSMFPQLVAGPIVRASDILDQLRQAPPVTENDRYEGFKLIITGYFKKMVIANNFAPVIEHAFNNPIQTDCLYWWVVMLLFAFQIYCDFSGYSDIAIGLARWMGYAFKPNFNHPYLSASFQEFWTRWHISLSSWFRDYVYIPLGGSHHGAWRTWRNLWITLLLSGLWHGAAWNFLCWGAAHATLLSVEKLTGWPGRLTKWPGGRLLAIPVVFALTLMTWVFFRAGSLSDALMILKTMLAFDTLTGWHCTILMQKRYFVLVCLALASQIWVLTGLPGASPILNDRPQSPFRTLSQSGCLGAMLFAAIILRGPESAFLYFQF